MTELEKEAEEFVGNKSSFWKQGKTCVESVKQAYIKGAEPREKRIEELEKENAELRYLANEKYVEQLTTAKEIIKSLFEDIFHFIEKNPKERGCKKHIDDMEKARDFIKFIGVND